MIKISKESFGKTSDDTEVMRYTLENGIGMRVCVISLGCAVQSIIVPDKDGALRDVALGYDDADSYEKGSCYFGAFVGRYANRIRGAQFKLNNIIYHLEENDGCNHLHGTFARHVFDAVIRDDAVVFPFVSPPSEEGYPGTLKGEVLYRLTGDNTLEIEYFATSDDDTVVNLTNHTYFNLNGHDGSDVLDHTIRLKADRFTPIDASHLTTGDVLSVEGTPLDFRRVKAIGAGISSDHPQIRFASGYDHNLVLNCADGTLREFALVKSERTGIVLTASTTEPGVQLYTGNFIHEDAPLHGKGGILYPRFAGFCLEAQNYPDAVNHPGFPSPVLRKGEAYHQKTVYKFSLDT